MYYFKWLRRLIGGHWYKYKFAEYTPGLIGTTWVRKPLPASDSWALINEEHYTK